MIFDTDVLIWVQRGNPAAAKVLRNDSDPAISIFTYMELQQSARGLLLDSGLIDGMRT
uniref:PIN domain-containing protein n=1 Tax=Candidatus Kentrum sp. FM TaxID=2126340 RepID=A0A450SY01_9GAMM|nr:MAG: hypothetical protein BECKFM1743C_GA0114222_102383 [Candidatus Kentron sp. FM]VFJ75530.1 MAG: hypothetical protein BECKFM1743A_GA0114220_108421 [Candidatus Kentron sp. FM]VFK11783.1 MAG: hypothetical protein BECKFM1743B_GA0114221_102073 [Candidatus Kentron sp. FM]